VGNNTRTLDLLDEYQLSWTTWEYATLASNADIARSFVRPYVRAVAGALVRQAFDAAVRVYELVYQLDVGIAAPTEVFVPVAIHYGGPEGVNITVTPADAVAWTRPMPHLLWIAPRASAAPGQRITVTLAPGTAAAAAAA
jgi:hypothetical protein